MHSSRMGLVVSAQGVSDQGGVCLGVAVSAQGGVCLGVSGPLVRDRENTKLTAKLALIIQTKFPG